MTGLINNTFFGSDKKLALLKNYMMGRSESMQAMNTYYVYQKAVEISTQAPWNGI